MWWFSWRYLPHMKDEALSPSGYLMEQMPIAQPSDDLRADIEAAVGNIITLTQENSVSQHELLDWLRHEYGVAIPGQKLEEYAGLTTDDFVSEVKKRRIKGTPNLKPADTTALQKIHAEYAAAASARITHISDLEHRLSVLVNQAYGMTADEVELMWKTAPPRMPIARK